MMLSHPERKQAIRNYKERTAPRGAYAVRCTPTGRAWVGSSRNLDAAKNRTWFTLHNGSHPDKALQSEWNIHGERAFHYEILERLEDGVSDLVIADILKDKRRRWAAELSAGELDGTA
ncbi:MAG: GIY-YIG nuclease family protein [Bryobacteraceae bacterium]|jgi:hypothetical protein